MLYRLSLAVGAVLLSAPAFAGSLAPPVVEPTVVAPAPIIAPAPVLVEASENWTGFYVGGQLGWGSLDFESFEDDEDDLFDTEFDGTFGGFHAGYQYDFGRFVLGGEVDYDWTEIEVDPLEVGEGISLDGIGRLKLRAGYDAGRILPYLTAGWAAANLSSDNDAIADALDDTSDGSFWGAGVAYAVSDRFLVGGEYLTHSFEDSPFEARDFDVRTITLRGSFRF
jgi:outer membrane immunogenic protein